MQIKIIKDIDPEGSETLVFIANVVGNSCDDAKQIALRTDATFGLSLDVKDDNIKISETSKSASNLKSRFIDVDFESILKFLDLNEDILQSMRNIYTSEDLIGSSK